MSDRATIISVEFRNFKALKHYSLRLQRMNILVGPNNCGKSTILSAFRALAAGIRRARAVSPERLTDFQGICFGHRIAKENLPLTTENIHTDYDESEPTTVLFRISNGNRLRLYFPPAGDCILTAETVGRRPEGPAAFRKAFPISIGIVPVLGTVEHDEVVLTEDTVRRGMATHRASRQFRNYWHYFPEGFEEFAQLVTETWPGMEIQRPERVNGVSKHLCMLCLEKRIPRELFWAGSGFQIWCQLLSHITRSKSDSLMVVDEPEVYLHPDVQRQLIGILREIGPDVVMATHSTEIISEVDPGEILIIDKSRKSAERLKDIEGIQAALNSIGSVQNITLTRLARNRRVVFLEGPSDYALLRKFARKLGYAELGDGSEITPIDAGGFSSWERIRAFAWGVERTLESSLRLSAVFDRDYWCQEQVDSILAELQKHIDFVHIHRRKELENYLLVPAVIERAVKKALSERAKNEILEEAIDQTLDRITTELKASVQGQCIAKRDSFLQRTSRDQSTTITETVTEFDQKWGGLESRLEVVPGKLVLRRLREELQSKYGISLTEARIVNEFRRNEIPSDLCELLRGLDQFRKGTARPEG